MTLFKVLLTIAVFFVAEPVLAQKELLPQDKPPPKNEPIENVAQDSSFLAEFPDPKLVMRRSLMLPGWGQVTNKQAWKIPLVYGLIGGLTYYSISLTKDYHDYRAAYYNAASGNEDLLFGPTPDYLMGANTTSLQNNRDFLRNRRDFMYITIGLAYLLNVVDAYVFAHLRPFDVSDDLSVSPALGSTTLYAGEFGQIPALTFSLNLSR